jgi:hypothetical protein
MRRSDLGDTEKYSYNLHPVVRTGPPPLPAARQGYAHSEFRYLRPIRLEC